MVRLNSFDPINLAGSAAPEQFDQIHRTQPGYVGTIVVDLQAGRRLVLNLWESEEDSAAALSVVGPKSVRLLEPFMSHASELVGAGTVISTDLVPRSRICSTAGLLAVPMAVGCCGNQGT
ncbi:MAG TPA: hypothetical protein VJ820_04675 [Propionibacteriaceae bacterium]|nr:hypothetical protein [Propionibacteriaceae bacterium]